MESCWSIGHSKKQLSKWQLSPSLISCSLIVQLKKSSVGKNSHLSFYRKEKERLCPRSRCFLSRWICLRRKLASIRLFRWGETASLVGISALQTDSLLLDEPTNHLDIKYQLDLLAIVKNLKVNVLAFNPHSTCLSHWIIPPDEKREKSLPRDSRSITLSHCKLCMEFKVSDLGRGSASYVIHYL